MHRREHTPVPRSKEREREGVFGATRSARHRVCVISARTMASPWTLSSEDVALYKQMFESADSARAGKVEPAGSQLSRSGLPGPTLMQIWRCAPVGE